jgi:hypothetical protein
MGRWLVGILDRIIGVICALMFAQLPLFIQQYQHQLLGHVAELHMQVEAVKNAAHANGKTLLQYIQRFIDSADIDFAKQGELLQNMYERSTTLAQSSLLLEQATPFQKPVIFFKLLNLDIASHTFDHFQPGIPLSLEGALYGFVGLLFGYGAFYCLKSFLLMLFRRPKAQEKTKAFS